MYFYRCFNGNYIITVAGTTTETVNQIELRDSIKKLAVPLPKTVVTNNLLVTVARFFGITWPHLKE